MAPTSPLAPKYCTACRLPSMETLSSGDPTCQSISSKTSLSTNQRPQIWTVTHKGASMYVRSFAGASRYGGRTRTTIKTRVALAKTEGSIKRPCALTRTSACDAFRRETRRTEGFQRSTCIPRIFRDFCGAPPTNCGITGRALQHHHYNSTNFNGLRSDADTNNDDSLLLLKAVQRAANAPREPKQTVTEGHPPAAPASRPTLRCNGNRQGGAGTRSTNKPSPDIGHNPENPTVVSSDRHDAFLRPCRGEQNKCDKKSGAAFGQRVGTVGAGSSARTASHRWSPKWTN